MPVEFQKMIYRTDCQANPEKFYVFGDNEWRRGNGGQAKEMRGEPNVIGVRTKAKPSQEPNSFWSDDNLERNCAFLFADFFNIIDKLHKGHTVVFPVDGLGTGLSELPTRAPKTMLFIELMIAFCAEI